MKLISTTDYVFYANGWFESKLRVGGREANDMILIYAYFVKRPLELGMVIPCDLDGNVLGEPTELYLRRKYGNFWNDYQLEEEKQYQEAKDRVLFEGLSEGGFHGGISFTIGGRYLKYWETNQFFEIGNRVASTIEDLTSLGLTLTESAKKLIN